jgi:hypothetical protein
MAISVKTFPKGQPVSYDTFRQQIQTGDIMLCSGSGWFSKMIQGSTESVWSHVGFVMRLDAIDPSWCWKASSRWGCAPCH